MSIEQKLCEVKIFQLQSMSNVMGCVDQRFAFKNSSILCLALIFNLSTTVLFAKRSVAGGEIRRVIYNFFQQLIQTNGLVVKAVQFLMCAEMICSTSVFLRGTVPVSALTRVLFILLCSL